MLLNLVHSYKQAYQGLSKNSWYLSAVILVNRSGTMVVPFMSVYCLRQLHFSIVNAGIIMALFGLGSITGGFIGGKLTDKIGFYDLQVGALLSGGLLFVILGYQHTFLTMGIGVYLLGLCNDSFRPANAAAIAFYSSDTNKIRSYYPKQAGRQPGLGNRWCAGRFSCLPKLPPAVLGRRMYKYHRRHALVEIDAAFNRYEN